MPLLIATIAGWLAVNWRLIAIGFTISEFIKYLKENGFDQIINKWIVSEVEARAGLHLDVNEPLSDQSLSRALSERVGFTISTIKDRQRIKDDLLAGAAQIATQKSGFAIRSLVDKDMLIQDLSAGAAQILERRTGLKLTDLRDPVTIKNDLLSYGAGRIAAEAGIYLSNPADMEAVKEDLRAWGAEQAMTRVVNDLSAALATKTADGTRLSTLLEKAGMKNVKPAEMVKHANGVLLGYANNRYQQVKTETKADRRRAQCREAARRFRAKHQQPWSKSFDGRLGGMTYVPVTKYDPLRKKRGGDSRPAEAAPVADQQSGAGVKPGETYGQSKAAWAKDGKWNKGKEQYPMSKPTTPAGIKIGAKK